MDDIVIAAAARTPVGSFNGGLGSLSAHALGAIAVNGVLERAGIAAADVNEISWARFWLSARAKNPAHGYHMRKRRSAG